jgi:hypothetical protein
VAINLNNQSVLDLSVQHSGSVSAVLEMCVLNDYSLDEIITPGQTVKLAKTDYGFDKVAAYFKANKIEPATAFLSWHFEQLGTAEFEGGQADFLNDFEKHVLEHQSVFDLCSQYHGTATATLEMILSNNLSIDEIINPGQIVKLQNKDYGYGENVAYYLRNNIQPATVFIEVEDTEIELLEYEFPGEFPFSF